MKQIKCKCGYEEFFHTFANRLHTALKPVGKMWQKENGKPNTFPDTVGVVEWMVKRYTPVESLAELAWDKGYSPTYSKDLNGHLIVLRQDTCMKKGFTGKSYIEAEAKAREFLNGLPDKVMK